MLLGVKDEPFMLLKLVLFMNSQVCNHPCLSYPLPYHFDPAVLVGRCGKFAVLDRILVKLHATGALLRPSS